MKVDDLDRKILSIISTNARLPFKDVADACGVSRAAVHQHVERMIKRGVITGSQYTMNVRDLGYSTTTFIGIRLEKASLYKEIIPHLEVIPEIVECHYTTGPYNMLIKLYARDNDHIMSLLSDNIQAIPGIASTETLICLSEGFKRNAPMPSLLEKTSEEKEKQQTPKRATRRNRSL